MQVRQNETDREQVAQCEVHGKHDGIPVDETVSIVVLGHEVLAIHDTLLILL